MFYLLFGAVDGVVLVSSRTQPITRKHTKRAHCATDEDAHTEAQIWFLPRSQENGNINKVAAKLVRYVKDGLRSWLHISLCSYTVHVCVCVTDMGKTLDAFISKRLKRRTNYGPRRPPIMVLANLFPKTRARRFSRTSEPTRPFSISPISMRTKNIMFFFLQIVRPSLPLDGQSISRANLST